MTLRHFKLSEFTCRCGCGQNGISFEFVAWLDQVRDNAKVPFPIVSGYRCEKHNAEVKGVTGSAHWMGLAADIAATDNRTRFAMVRAMIDGGAHRIGIGKKFIHVDLDGTKPQLVLWLYP